MVSNGLFFSFMNTFSYLGASISGGYWGLLGALTPFAYWGAREGMHFALILLRRLFLLLARHSMLAPSALASCVGSAFCILHFAFCILHFCILLATPLCRPHRWH